MVQLEGGERKRSQLRQKDTEAGGDRTVGKRARREGGIREYVPCFGMPSVISTVLRRHPMQRLALFGVIGVPQSAHSTRCTAGAGMNSIASLKVLSRDGEQSKPQ